MNKEILFGNVIWYFFYPILILVIFISEELEFFEKIILLLICAIGYSIERVRPWTKKKNIWRRKNE